MKTTNSVVIDTQRLAVDNAVRVDVCTACDVRTQDHSDLTFGAGYAPLSLAQRNHVQVKPLLIGDRRTSDKSGLSFGAGSAPHAFTKVS